MLDTLMALWNQDRRKRAGQAILTFFLMCIGISLLFVITSKSAESQHQQQRVSLSHANSTVPPFGSTVVPDLTPTVSVVVGTIPKPVATTTTPPCSTTPSGITSQTPSLHVDALAQLSSTLLHSSRRTSTIPPIRFDGGPIHTLTPVPSTPTPAPAQQHGWVSNCTTSNNLSSIAGDDVVTLLAQNTPFILASALLGTVLFYAILFLIKRRMHE